MPARFHTLVIDCHDPQRLAEFWSRVLGFKVVADEEDEVMIAESDDWSKGIAEAPVVPALLFGRVPEEKGVKNRLHIDLRPVAADQTEEVERILSLGATHVDIGQREQTWVVLADPEGNEFCVLRNAPF